MDVYNKTTRSYNMSQIKGKNTKLEEKVRKHLFSQGFRYWKNDKRLPGTPDVVLPKYKTVIFVNGCFWHGHSGCECFVWPKNNANFWKNKIENNIIRDRIKEEKLCALGWRVIVIWGCELKSRRLNESMEQLKRNILEGEQWGKIPNMTP